MQNVSGKTFFIMQMCSSTQGIGKPPPVSILICFESMNLKKGYFSKTNWHHKDTNSNDFEFSKTSEKTKKIYQCCSWLQLRRILGQGRIRIQTPTYCDIICYYFWVVCNILLRCVIKIILLEIIVVIISKTF